MADAVKKFVRRTKGAFISIVYITAREEPHLEWLIEDLDQQAGPGDALELVVVDALGRSARELGFRPIRAIKRLVETRPKPSIWQGPHRVTQHDFYANANARNTALVLCGASYVCFLDDRSRLDPGWLDVVRRGEKERRSVLCGTYTKHTNRGIEADRRRDLEPHGKSQCSGGWCFGANFALPLAWALGVNGFEEGCDPVGLEDCAFGHMLSNAGRRLDYVVKMSVQLDRRGPIHPPSFPRLDRGVAPNDKSHALEKRFYDRKRTEFTPDLKALRAARERGKEFPIHSARDVYRDWYDGTLINGLRLASTDLTRASQGEHLYQSD